MGVRSLNSGGYESLVSNAARTPAPRPRTAEAERETAPAARARPEPSEINVQRVADGSGEYGPSRTETRLRVDKGSKQIVAQIVNENNEVVKQIPPEELLKIAARFRELRGKLFDVKV